MPSVFHNPGTRLNKADQATASALQNELKSKNCTEVKVLLGQTFPTIVQASVPIRSLSEADVAERNQIYKGIKQAFLDNGMFWRADGNEQVTINKAYDIISNGGLTGKIYGRDPEGLAMDSKEESDARVAMYAFGPNSKLTLFLYARNAEKSRQNVMQAVEGVFSVATPKKASVPPSSGTNHII
jgi:hypothetical protein